MINRKSKEGMVEHKKNIFYVCLFILLFACCPRGTAFPDTLKNRCREALEKEIRPGDPGNSVELVKAAINDIKKQKLDYLEQPLYPEMRVYYERLQLKLGNYYFAQEKEFEKALQCFIEADRYSSRGYNEKIANCKKIIGKEKKVKKKLEEALAYYQMAKYDKAREAFLQARELKPEHPKTQESINIHLQKTQQWETVDYHNINPADFIKFKRENNNALILDEFKQKLYDTFQKLPPEDYLQYLRNKRNSQFYWEAKIDNHIMVYIPEKQIFVDKYEVSFALLEMVKDFKKKRLKINKKSKKNKPPGPTIEEFHPAVVSFKEAEEYCKKKGFRLLTEEEWEFIAGKKGTKDDAPYPWGEEEVDDSGIYRANYESFEDGNDHLARVMSYLDNSSPYGIVNLAGNVWEWVQGKKCKGGGFLSGKQDLKITGSAEKEIWVGFRCAKEVKQ